MALFTEINLQRKTQDSDGLAGKYLAQNYLINCTECLGTENIFNWEKGGYITGPPKSNV
jgi:hypothetical protein